MGGNGDSSLVREIARTLDTCEGLDYMVLLMAQDRPAEYKPSELRRDLREKLERATAVFMVVPQSFQDQINEQVREYLQATTKYPQQRPNSDIRHQDHQPSDFRPFDLDTWIHPVMDRDMKRISEIVSRPPSREEKVRRIIKGIISSVSKKPDSTTILR